MKKILAIVLALTVVLVCFAACGNKTATDANVNTNTDAATTEGANNGEAAPADYDAVGLLTSIFATYAEENSFPIGGGDEANMNFEGPGKYDVALAEELNVIAYLPATQNDNIAEAANVMNMMNANSFTAAAYLLKDGADADAFAADFKVALDNARWMCGFPEKYVVIKVGSYIITAYGLADFISYFNAQTASVYADAVVVLEGDIVA